MLRYLIALAAALACLGLVACGDDDDDGDGGSAIEAETLEPSQAEGATGDVTWCIGKDTTGAFTAAVEDFNAQNPDLQAELLELPEAADAQREQQVQRLRAESDECDVLGMDVIWTAEYAAAGWLFDVTPAIEAHEGEFIQSTVDTAEFDDRIWAVPFNTNAGFLFYRTDQVPEAPATWEEIYDAAQQQDGLVYQGAAYEGLTVNFLELLYSAGGAVLSEDGETVEIDSPETREALEFMASGIDNGAVPQAVRTYEEEDSRRVFEAGKATFMRNWPYAYALGKESNIADDFDVTTFPGYGGGEGAGALGGYNLGISAFSANPEGALAFAEFLVTPDIQKQMMIDASLPATVSEVYSDPEVVKATPFAPDLLTAVEQADPRPVSPVYPQITQAIYDNVYAVLGGDATPDEATTAMNEQIQEALETF
jgi:multiple sugar transport system substrate-binding protein